MAFEGRVKTVKMKEYTNVPVLTPSLVNPKSAARLSEMALAIIILKV